MFKQTHTTSLHDIIPVGLILRLVEYEHLSTVIILYNCSSTRSSNSECYNDFCKCSQLH